MDKVSINQDKTINPHIERERYHLNLRKKALQSKLVWKQLENALEDEKQFNFKPSQLKIDKLLSQLRIRDEESLNKAFALLNSQGDEAKFGIFLFRKYFQEKIKEQPREILCVDLFLSKGLISSFERILFSNRFEIFWTLINFTNYPLSNSQYDYYSLLLTDRFFEIYSYILQNSKKEVIKILFDFLYNMGLDNTNSNIIFISHPQFIQSTLNCLREKDLSLTAIRSIFNFIFLLTREQAFTSLSTELIQKIFVALQKTIETVSDDSLVLQCLHCLDNLSESKYNVYFLSIGLLRSLLKNKSNQPNIINQTLKIIGNLIISLENKNELFEALFQCQLLDYYLKSLDANNSTITKREILMSLANIALREEKYVIAIVKHELFPWIVHSLEHMDFIIRRNAMITIFHCVDFESLSLEPIFLSNDLIQHMVHHLSYETDEEILKSCLLTILRFSQIELNVSEEKVKFLRQYLLTNGIEEHLLRNEITNSLLPFTDQLKRFLYDNSII